MAPAGAPTYPAPVTTAAWVFLGCAAVFAVGDWIAVARGDRRLELVCKPGATLALVGVAATLDAVSSSRQSWFVVALVLSLVGDVFLMASDRWFVVGLGAFLLAQLAYVAGFATGDVGALSDYLVGAAIVAAVSVPLLIRFGRALRRTGRADLLPPVVVYFLAIGAMVTSAIASGNALAIVGAFLFLVSDATIGETRFVGERPHGRVTIMVTYHFAQAALVLSLL